MAGDLDGTAVGETHAIVNVTFIRHPERCASFVLLVLSLVTPSLPISVRERGAAAPRVRFVSVPDNEDDFDPIVEAGRQWREHGWETAAPGMGVVTSIMRAQQILLARADAVLGDLPLTFARFEVLTLLSFTRAGALPMGKLGTRLQVHPASVTSAVARLERQGFVRRQKHPSDGRVILAVLTDEGRRVAAEAAEALNAEVFEALDLTAAEANHLFALLARLR